MPPRERSLDSRRYRPVAVPLEARLLLSLPGGPMPDPFPVLEQVAQEVAGMANHLAELGEMMPGGPDRYGPPPGPSPLMAPHGDHFDESPWSAPPSGPMSLMSVGWYKSPDAMPMPPPPPLHVMAVIASFAREKSPAPMTADGPEPGGHGPSDRMVAAPGGQADGLRANSSASPTDSPRQPFGSPGLPLPMSMPQVSAPSTEAPKAPEVAPAHVVALFGPSADGAAGTGGATASTPMEGRQGSTPGPAPGPIPQVPPRTQAPRNAPVDNPSLARLPKTDRAPAGQPSDDPAAEDGTGTARVETPAEPPAEPVRPQPQRASLISGFQPTRLPAIDGPLTEFLESLTEPVDSSDQGDTPASPVPWLVTALLVLEAARRWHRDRTDATPRAANPVSRPYSGLS